jgi:hypothetical protein
MRYDRIKWLRITKVFGRCANRPLRVRAVKGLARIWKPDDSFDMAYATRRVCNINIRYSLIVFHIATLLRYTVLESAVNATANTPYADKQSAGMS